MSACALLFDRLPGREEIPARIVRQPHRVGAIRTLKDIFDRHHVNLFVAIAVGNKDNELAIWRPGGLGIIVRVVRQTSVARIIPRVDIDCASG